MNDTRTTPFAATPRRFKLAAAALLFTAVLGCHRGDSFTPAEHIERARTQMAAKQWNGATIELKSALQKDPANGEARLLLADTYIALSRGPAAEAELDRAVESGIDVETTRVRRGRAYALQGNYDKVLKEVAPVLIGDAADVADRFELRGDAELNLGKPAEALKSYNTVQNYRPTSIPALLGKARLAAAQRDLANAGQLIDTALSVDPNNTNVLIAKGDLQIANGDLNAAIGSYEKAVASNADSVTAHLALASALLTAHRIDEARTHIAMIKKAYPYLPSVNYTDSVMLFAEGKNAEALEAVQKVLASIPDYPAALALSGAIQYALGTQAQAEVNARKFLKAYPNNVFGRKLLAAILLKQKQAGKALEVLEPMVGSAQLKDPEVFMLAGSAYLLTGQVAKAVATMQRAQTIQPESTSIKTAIAVGNLAAGDVDDAIGAFQSLVKLGAGNREADNYLVLSFIGKKAYPQAIAAALDMTKRYPDDPEAFNLLGGAYQAANDLPAAKNAFGKALELKPTFSPAVVNLARLDLIEKKPADAKKRLEAALAKDDKNLEIIFALSNLGFLRGDNAEGGRWLQEAVKASPDTLPPRMLLIQHLLRQHDAQKAVQIARDTDAKFPGDPDLLSLLAESQAAAGDRNGSVATYGRLASLAPNAPRVQLEIARQESSDGHFSAAAAALVKALAISPQFTDAQVALAGVDVQMRKYDDALAIGAALRKQAPASGIGEMVIGDVSMAQQKFDRAAKSYEDAYGLSKSGIIVSKLHAALNASGRKADADKVIGSWIAANPNDLSSRLYLAASTARAGDSKRAEGLYQEVLGIDGNNAIALNELALMLDARDDSRGLDYAAKAYALQPGSFAIGDTYGWILVRRGKIAEGRKILESILAASPEYSEARYHLAVAQSRSGDKAGAKANLERALKSNDTFAEIDDARVMLEKL